MADALERLTEIVSGLTPPARRDGAGDRQAAGTAGPASPPASR